MKIRRYFCQLPAPVSLLVGIMLATTFASFSQEKKNTVPDGTEGEVLEVKDSIKKNNKQWNSFDLDFTTLKIGIGMAYEFNAFSQNDVGKIQTDSLKSVLESSFKTRDFRILVSGKLRTKRTITWKAGFMYDGVQNEWFLRESGFMIAVPELWGHFFIGRTKEGYSQSKVQNGYAGEAMERHTALDPIPILADGVKWLGYLPKQGIVWNVGIFTDWLSKNEGFATNTWQFITRVGWLPIHDESAKTNLHIGASFRVGHPDNDNMRVRSKPEANSAPFFIDTQEFPTNKTNSIGGEVYYSNGPWMVGSEYHWHMFKSAEKNNPVFSGGEVVVTYIFTGESRPYSTVSGIYGFVPVNKSIFKGGPGAFEGVLRFTSFDLDDGPIKGGRLWRLTPELNWFPSTNFRLVLAYGYAVLNRYNLKGATQIFQTRLQFSIL